MVQKEYWSVEEVACFLGVKRSTVYSLTERGELPHYRIGRLIRFKKEDIEDWMKGQRIEKTGGQHLPLSHSRRVDVDRLVKKIIDRTRGPEYNALCGESGQSQGLGKEV
ncbi:MAG: helix-turn-helix domain-containing protein [Candidatus Methanomethylicaceae archaeon]